MKKKRMVINNINDGGLRTAGISKAVIDGIVYAVDVAVRYMAEYED
jgi:hypothetical protein